MAEGFEKRYFHIADYIIFILTLCISLAIGIYYAVSGGRQKTTGEYLMGDRNLKVLPVAVSMLVSFISSVGILGTPAEMYSYGTQFIMHVIAGSLGCTYAALIVVPLLYPLKLTSVFEYFELRYKSGGPRLVGSFITILNSLFLIGIGMYSPSVALEAVSGIKVWMSMVILCVVVTIYTTLGGMKAVVWTDMFQSIIIFGGLIAIVAVGVVKVGGFDEVWELNDKWGRIEFFNFDPDPRTKTTFWSVVVMLSILWMCMASVQMSVQRYCALPTMTQARVSVLLNIPGFILFGLCVCGCGIVAFAYYAQKGCDPWISAKYIDNPNQILPYFVMDVMGYPGIPGLFVACIYSSSLSTASSVLNALAAITWEDFMKPFLNHLTEVKKTYITKTLVVVYGVISLGVGFTVQLIGGTFIAIVFSIMGTTTGPVVGMLFLGGLYPKAGPRGAMLGAVVGLALSLWMAIGAYQMGYYAVPLPMPSENCPFANVSVVPLNGTVGNGTMPGQGLPPGMTMEDVMKLQRWERGEFIGLENLYAVSYYWYPSVGIICVLLFGICTSCIPGMKQEGYVKKKYLFPCIRYVGDACQGYDSDEDHDDSDDDADEKTPMKYDPNKNKYRNDQYDEPYESDRERKLRMLQEENRV